MAKIKFQSFSMGDVEEPESYAYRILNEFMLTDKGLWISANCPNAEYTLEQDGFNWGLLLTIHGEVEDKLATEYYLKWGSN